MNLPNADHFYRNFRAAAAQVRNGLEICRSWDDRDQAELAEIEAELGKLDETAKGRDLAFWTGKQGGELHVALDQLQERVVRESRR
jgi:hypothetical protein